MKPMSEKKPSPGVSRGNRISDEGLQRLRMQLSRGTRIARPVLQQWVRRYGEPARELIAQFGYELDD